MRPLIFISTVVLLVSCSKQMKLPATDLANWVENPDNGLHKCKAIGEINYDLQLTPSGYMFLKENIENPSEAYQARTAALDSFFHFNLRFSVKGLNADPMTYNIGSQEEYTHRDLFLGYEFKNTIKQVYLLNNNTYDTVRCSVYSFVQNFGLAPYMDCVFAFKKKHQSYKEFNVLFDDQVFKNGPVRFNYTYSETQNLPTLKLENEN